MSKVALVTGGETGIGLAVSDALRAEGYDVKSASRRSGCDLADPEAVKRLAASFERLDLLVNNAGIAEAAPLKHTGDKMWQRHLAINATAPFLLCRGLAPLLGASPTGHIVNIASTAALQGAAYVTAYTASKHALLGLSRALAEELKDVRVDAVCPGFVDSPLTDRSVANIVEKTDLDEEGARAALAARNPSGKLVTPAEVAAAVVDLLRTKGSGREIVLG